MMHEFLIQQLKTEVLNTPDIEVFHTEVTTSTNDWAWHYLSSKPANFDKPTLFIATEQKQGRGTQGRMWHSPAGTGLYMSLLMPLPQQEQHNIHQAPSQFEQIYFTQGKGFTKATGVASVLALTVLFPWLRGNLGIRSINDLFVNHRKLGGILVETKLRANGRLKAIVTGLGLNILYNDQLAIKDERNTPISLEECARLLNIQQEWMLPTELGFLISKHILALYALLQNGQIDDIEALWQEFGVIEF
jgi:biotin-(acetyl-CoA carboxylase) ligase